MYQERYNSLRASLEEFVAICAVGGTASLTLNTSNYITKKTLDVSLGHPGSPFLHPTLHSRAFSRISNLLPKFSKLLGRH